MKPPQDEISQYVRPLVDDEVDRLGVEVPQGMELTNTNRSRAYPKSTNAMFQFSDSVFREQHSLTVW